MEPVWLPSTQYAYRECGQSRDMSHVDTVGIIINTEKQQQQQQQCQLKSIIFLTNE